MSELRTRAISGLVMGAVGLASLVAGGWPWAALAALVGVLVALEWGGLTRSSDRDAAAIVSAAGVVAAVSLVVAGVPAYALMAVAAAAVAAGLLAAGKGAGLATLGALYAGLPAAALVWIRGGDRAGLLAGLFVVLAVVATDTFAYFTGRAVGGPKLMPSVSPGKTWSGLGGGVAGAMAVGAVMGLVAHGRLSAHLVVAGALIALVAQAGDLLESALKRSQGRKDSGALIPGHGGIMDRVDGLVMAALAAAVYAMAVNPQSPAAAILGHN